eukprot:GABV01001974.1.p1 GENE.GABV01001974.1~~GABV01001974.1.p1  ORF type:complete len:144 (-),score=55.34 GABV01001974.1:15-446(-)
MKEKAQLEAQVEKLKKINTRTHSRTTSDLRRVAASPRAAAAPPSGPGGEDNHQTPRADAALLPVDEKDIEDDQVTRLVEANGQLEAKLANSEQAVNDLSKELAAVKKQAEAQRHEYMRLLRQKEDLENELEDVQVLLGKPKQT